MLAPDTSIKVDVAETLEAGVFLAGNLVDTVDGADLQARLATRASIGVYDG
jgi:hypothetical protein